MTFTPDVINGLFEFVGAFVIVLSIKQVLADKEVKGINWATIAFFAGWGMWNLYYYPHLDQWLSFVGGIAIVATNLVYVSLLIYYSREWSPGQDILDRGYWKETYTGAKFYLMDPKPEEVVMEDVLHSLAYQCRYTGHCLRWYSVAEHCCLIADYVRDVLHGSPRDQFNALMHDAPEYITGDISRPMKYGIPGLKPSLAHIDKVVYKALGVTDPEPRWLKEIDARIIVDERTQNMVDSGNEWNHDKFEPLGVTLQYWGPERAKVEFLTRYLRIKAEMEKANG